MTKEMLFLDLAETICITEVLTVKEKMKILKKLKKMLDIKD
jgi:hypothetical protein